MIGLLGASGYMGQSFINELVNEDIAFLELSRKKHNYYDLESLINFINKYPVEALINCAGYTGKPNVDACENNQNECYEANVELAKTIALACSLTDTKLLHISSGCIYTGDKDGEGFTEEDAPNFHHTSEIKGSYYSGTKTIAESIVKNTWNNSYIARLRIPFDEIDSPRNYLTKLQKYTKLLNATNSISHRADFTKACIHLLKNKAEFGIYNITNTDPINTSQVADLLKEYKFIDSYELVEEEDFYKKVDAKAPRSNCVLNNDKIINTGFNMRTSEEALVDSLENWKKSE
tara:strand:+ start:367 stop:1239 length:873 start_codon:yes stop_codon:yes gene_type:complete